MQRPHIVEHRNVHGSIVQNLHVQCLGLFVHAQSLVHYTEADKPLFELGMMCRDPCKLFQRFMKHAFLKQAIAALDMRYGTRIESIESQFSLTRSIRILQERRMTPCCNEGPEQDAHEGVYKIFDSENSFL